MQELLLLSAVYVWTYGFRSGWVFGAFKEDEGVIVRRHTHPLSGKETPHSLRTFFGVLAPRHGQYVERAIVQATVQLATPCVVMGLPRDMHRMYRLNSIGHPILYFIFITIIDSPIKC